MKKESDGGFIDKLETLLDMAEEIGLKIPEVVIVDHSTFMKYRTDSGYHRAYADLLSKRRGPSGFGVPGYREFGLFRGTLIKEGFTAYTEG